MLAREHAGGHVGGDDTAGSKPVPAGLKMNQAQVTRNVLAPVVRLGDEQVSICGRVDNAVSPGGVAGSTLGAPGASRRPRVRTASAADLPALTAIYNPYVRASAAAFDTEPFTIGQRWPWFDCYADSGPHRLVVAADDTGVLGYATSSQFRAKPAYSTSIEVSAYCHPQARSQGIG